MSETNESPWAVLARRLLCSGNNGTRYPLGFQRFQSMLVGETLRVAWKMYTGLYCSVQDHTEIRRMAEKIWQESDGGNARATACIELLDAVGWKGEG